LDAEAEQVGQAADVAAGGVGLVEDAVFADGGDRQVGAAVARWDCRAS
jgi:hypothetical protein